MFGSPLENYIYILGTYNLCLCASFQELVLLPYVVKVLGLVGDLGFGIWESSLFCQTLSLEVHERKIGAI